MKITDIHSHTYFSACGRDNPVLTINAAVNGGIEVFGISDHHYGIGNRMQEYRDIISSLKKEYKDKILLLAGVEISSLPRYAPPKEEDVKKLDYCLLEHLDWDESVSHGKLFEYFDFYRKLTRTGIAHTDIFLLAERCGMSDREFVYRMRDLDIFWEMNVNFDSIHGYREHRYVKDFFASEQRVALVRDAGLKISVGFDGHRVEDYLPARVIDACKKIDSLCLSGIDFE